MGGNLLRSYEINLVDFEKFLNYENRIEEEILEVFWNKDK